MWRGSTWLLASVFSLGAFSGCLDDGESLSLGRPVWSSGYAFSYEMTGQSTEEENHVGDGDSGRSSNSDTLGPISINIEVLNTTMHAGDDPVYLAALTSRDTNRESAPAPFIMNFAASLTAYRQRDLAEVVVDLVSSHRSCEDGACESAKITAVGFGESPDMTYLDFPLTKGKSWSSPAADDDELGWIVRAEVGSPKTVQLSVGSVRALPVVFKYSATNLDKFIEDQKRESDGQVDSYDFRPTRQLTVYYADDYQTVVRSVTDVGLDIRASGKDEQGRPAMFEGHYEAHIEQVLTGARLVALPERGLDYISQVMDGTIDLIDPSGHARRPVGYTLAVDPARRVVNAAEEPDVSFSAKVVGDPAAFQGHAVTWRLVDYFGNQVAAGEGVAGAHRFDEPGYYTAEFEARDADGQVTAAASGFILANYAKSTQVTCTLVTPVPITPCPDASAPVRPGIRSATVAARVSSPLDVLSQGTLVLTDPAGREWRSSTASGGRYEIIVDDFTDAAVGDEDWVLSFEDLLAVQQVIGYEVELSYDPSTPVVAHEMGSPGVGVPDASIPKFW